MRDRRSSLAVAVVVTVASLAGTSPACAADWSEGKKSFRESQNAKEWKLRRDGYLALSDHDRAEAVDEALAAAAKETHGAVLWQAVSALAGYRSPGAVEALASAAKTAKGLRRHVAILALGDPRGGPAAGRDALIEVVKGTDGPSAMLAAQGLGKRREAESRAALVEALRHKEWQVRGAAARALGALPGAAPKEILQALVETLVAAEGRERGDVVAGLEAATKATFGYDVEAWKALAGGAAASGIARNPASLPHAFGVPVYGKRVVVVVDHCVTTDDPHPFQDLERLQEVCKVPGGRDVPWYSLKTILQLFVAHAKRLVDDLPAGSQVDVVTAARKPKSQLTRLQPATAGSRGTAAKALDAMKPENGLDLAGALLLALDAGGKDSAAWAGGPDEIVLFDAGVPWLSDMNDGDEVAAVVSWRARVRGVAIQAIGVGRHPTEPLRVLADRTGGRYVDLSK